VVLTLGTGIGAGVVTDGKILHGHFENAAELGHMIVECNGVPCACGQRGCLEAYASASAVARRARSALDGKEQSSLTARVEQGGALSAEDVVAAAKSGDQLSLRIWNETCRYLAVGCINIQHAFNPQRIALGGGMARAGAFLLDGVRRYVRDLTWKLHDDVPEIVLAELGYDAGIIGAAALAWTRDQPE
jgi:glucokinase